MNYGRHVFSLLLTWTSPHWIGKDLTWIAPILHYKLRSYICQVCWTVCSLWFSVLILNFKKLQNFHWFSGKQILMRTFWIFFDVLTLKIIKLCRIKKLWFLFDINSNKSKVTYSQLSNLSFIRNNLCWFYFLTIVFNDSIVFLIAIWYKIIYSLFLMV